MIDKLYWIGFLMIFIACKDQNTRIEELIQEKLAAQQKQFTDEKNLECDKRIQEKLEQYADSILIVLSKKIKYDSLTIPYDSIRPEKPEIEFPEYTKPEKQKGE
ncbi:MAG: hypothetical protein IPM92_09405 [Saprospiraceae bacterium]|nr:hypothetical protein [Saprospiraceae bacterium]